MFDKKSMLTPTPSLILTLIFFVSVVGIWSCRSKQDGTSTQTVYTSDDAIIESRRNVFKLSNYMADGRSDAEALQLLLSQKPANKRRVTYDLEGYNLTLDKTVYYQKFIGRITIIQGNGARLNATGDFDILVPDGGLGDRVGVGGENDIHGKLDALQIYDVDFIGGRDQLRIVGTYQSKVENCRFHKGNRGLQVVFGLQTVVDHCEFYDHDTEGLVFRSGMSDEALLNKMGAPVYETDQAYFSNANGTNSQSNRSIVQNSRFLSGNRQPFCLRVQASDEVQANNCIFEGGDPVYSIYFDNRGSQTTRAFQVNYPHIEHGDKAITQALIYARGTLVELRGIFQQYGGVPIVDARAQKVVIESPRYLLLGDSVFRPNKTQHWVFKDSNLDTEVLRNPATWCGRIPNNAVHEGISIDTYLGKYGGGMELTESGMKGIFTGYGEGAGLIDFSSEAGRSSQFKHSIKSEFDTYSTPRVKGLDLNNYEISHMRPVTMFNKTGQKEVGYIPYLREK